MKISKKGLDLIKHFESLHDGNLTKIGLQPKMCPAGIWTVGYGFALINPKTGKWLKGASDFSLISKYYPQYENMTEAQADALLSKTIVKFEDKVNSSIKIVLTQDKFDALVSHTYNTGGSGTLFLLINSLAPISKIMTWFTTKYITGGGKILKGLILRRKSEFVLYSTGVLKYE